MIRPSGDTARGIGRSRLGLRLKTHIAMPPSSAKQKERGQPKAERRDERGVIDAGLLLFFVGFVGNIGFGCVHRRDGVEKSGPFLDPMGRGAAGL